jgi:hypothetical protein
MLTSDTSIIPEAQARVYWTMVWLHELGDGRRM